MPALKSNTPVPSSTPAYKHQAIQFIKYWMPAIIYAIIIFSISAIPGRDIPNLFSYQDIFFHIAEYGIFAFLVNRALKGSFPATARTKRFFWVFFICFVYAISDEVHQFFVPGRSASGFDVTMDAAGILITNLYYVWQR